MFTPHFGAPPLNLGGSPQRLFTKDFRWYGYGASPPIASAGTCALVVIPPMKSPYLFVSVLAVCVLAGPRVFAGNPVLYWNDQVIDAARLARNPPPFASQHIAAFRAAIFDAVNGISYTCQGWLANDPAPDDANARPNPEFIPLMVSPAFPSYISGHSTFSAAASRLLERFFGTDEIEFSVRSDGLTGAVRSYKKLSGARNEIGMNRLWAGIHVMSDNLEGQKVGIKIADWVFEHALNPRPNPGCFTLYSIACMQTVDDPRAEPAGRHIRAKPAYPLTIATIGTASRRMTIAMAKTVKYAG